MTHDDARLARQRAIQFIDVLLKEIPSMSLEELEKMGPQIDMFCKSVLEKKENHE